MANIFTNLPRPAAANGSGAAVDTSGCGANKYIIVDGSWTLPDRPPTVTIEINNDATPNGTWAPLVSFVGNGKKAIQCAARWMRATVSNYRGGTNPLINFGSTDDPASFVTPAVPAADGVGAATDITALPEIKTVTIGDTFTGCIILEYSEDAGGVDWAELPAMWAPGTMTFPLIANWIRVRRQGIPAAATPGTPIVNLGGVAPSGGGTIDTIGVNVEDEGVPVLTPAQTLNFNGAGVTVTDGGSDTADITIPGTAWDVTEVFDNTDSPVSAAVGELVQLDQSTGDIEVLLPAVAAADEGLAIAVKSVSFDNAGGTVTITPEGADTIDGNASLVLTGAFNGIVLVFDGVSNWDIVNDYRLPRVATYTGDGTAPIDIEPADDTSWLVSEGAPETTQTFNLGPGTVEGQVHNISARAFNNTGTTVVEIADIDPGETGTTFTLAASTPGALILVWNGGIWSLLSTRGFVNS